MLFVGTHDDITLHNPRFLPPDESVGEVASAMLAGYLAALTRLPAPRPGSGPATRSRSPALAPTLTGAPVSLPSPITARSAARGRSGAPIQPGAWPVRSAGPASAIAPVSPARPTKHHSHRARFGRNVVVVALTSLQRRGATTTTRRANGSHDERAASRPVVRCAIGSCHTHLTYLVRPGARSTVGGHNVTDGPLVLL